jgi:hypothetical protein
MKDNLATWVFLITCIFSDNLMAEKEPFEIIVGTSQAYGSISGYLQTPAGGNPGSSSIRRPTFEELGFEDTNVNQGYFAFSKGNHTVLLDAHLVRLDGYSTLTEPLKSQYRDFAAGETVKADVQTDYYDLIYLYHFTEVDLFGKRMTISPGAGLVVFDFHYELAGASDKADRSYGNVGARIGGELNLTLTEKLSISADAFASIPISNTVSIYSLELLGEYQLWKTSRLETTAILGIAYDYIDYEDEQELPNHIRVELKPLLKIGIEIKF